MTATVALATVLPTSATIPQGTGALAFVSPDMLSSDAVLDGDLIFRTGTDVLTSLVLAQGSQSSYSHVGMLVVLNGGTYVVHVLPSDGHTNGGVRAEPLREFAAPDVASRLGHYRVIGLDDAQRARVKAFLLAKLGKPFDYRFRYSTDEEYYCTELVLKALAQAGIDLAPALQRVEVLTLDEGAIPPDSLASSSSIQKQEVARATAPR